MTKPFYYPSMLSPYCDVADAVRLTYLSAMLFYIPKKVSHRYYLKAVVLDSAVLALRIGLHQFRFIALDQAMIDILMILYFGNIR